MFLFRCSLILVLLLCLSNPIHARSVGGGKPVEVESPSDFASSMDVLKDFNEAVPKVLDKTLNSSQYKAIYQMLFLGFGLFFIVENLTKYILGGADHQMIFSAFLVLAFIGSAPLWYLGFLNAFLSWYQGLGNVIQVSILGNSNPNYPVEFMFNVIGSFSVDLGWNPISWINHIVEIIVLAIVSILLVMLAMFSVGAALVQSYVYVPVALTGLIVIPFGLVPLFGFILDGWLRLFLTIIFFGLFVRINVTLAVFALSLMFNVHEISDFSGRIFEFSTDNVLRLLGAASIALISLWVVLNSYAFAASLVNGSGNVFGGTGAVSGLNEQLKSLKK